MTCKRALIVMVSLGLVVVFDAQAHGDVHCTSPKSEWRRSVDLQRELKQRGWKVRSIRVLNGCYEVYGFDEADQRVEAFFDPRTFERVD